MSSISTQLWSAEAQAARREEQAAYIRPRLRAHLDDDAHSETLYWWDQGRVEIWASNAFFVGDAADVAFANTILRHVRDRLPLVSGPNVFEASALAAVVKQYRAKLESDVLAYCLEALEAYLPFGMTRDFQFHGFNDNMPVMWTWALAAGGDLLENARFAEVAWANLCQLRDLFRRRGAVSEYGQNYGTHRLTGMAHLGDLIEHPEVRALARDLEARIWAELAGHWHPALAQVGGASQRGGYAFIHETSALLRQVFGDEIAIAAAPWQAYFDDPAMDGHVFAYPWAYGAEFAAAGYHVPDAVAALFYAKPAGFIFQCTAEEGYANPGVFRQQKPIYGIGGGHIGWELGGEAVEIPHHPAHGAQPHALYTYSGANFSLGTSTTQQHETSHAFRCAYRRGRDAADAGDYGEIFARYNVNGKTAGGRTKNTYWKSQEHHDERENYCGLYWDRGRHHGLQHSATALCLQVPNWAEYWDVTSLATEIFFYQRHGKVGAVYLDDTPVTVLPAACSNEGLITIDEGAVYLAIRPLIGRHGAREAAIRLREVGEWLVLTLVNYEGPSREFSPREMAKMGNGFVFEARDAASYPSFAVFQEEMRQARWFDQLYGGVRRVHYARPDLRLSTVLCPYTNTVMSRSVNGLTPEEPRFRFSDGSHAGLPFLDDTPSVGFADWEWLTVQIEREAETYNVID
jgi:hypothetical protein